MKPIAVLIAVTGLWALPVRSQEAPTVKVDIHDLKVGSQQTPQFQAAGVTDKRWRPKTWLEVDLEFDIKLAQSEGGRRGSLDAMTVNYFIALNQMSKDGKRMVLKGTFNYIDIPAAETCHALAFVSPASLRRTLLKETFTAAADIQGWGVEVIVNGTRLTGKSSVGNDAWWDKGDNFNFVDGTMLAKQETPFAILWGDYDVLAKK